MKKILLIMLGGPPDARKARLEGARHFLERTKQTLSSVDIFLTGYPEERDYFRTQLKEIATVLENPDYAPINTYGNALDLEDFLTKNEKLYHCCVCYTSKKHSERFSLCFELLNLQRFFNDSKSFITYTAGKDGFSEPIKLSYYKLSAIHAKKYFGKECAISLLKLERSICHLVRKYIFFWKFKWVPQIKGQINFVSVFLLLSNLKNLQLLKEKINIKQNFNYI